MRRSVPTATVDEEEEEEELSGASGGGEEVEGQIFVEEESLSLK